MSKINIIINYVKNHKLGLLFLFIIFLEFTILPSLYPVVGDDLGIVRFETFRPFFNWNSRLGELIYLKVFRFIPYAITYSIMGLSYVILIILAFYMAFSKFPNLKSIKELSALTIIIFLMAFYPYTNVILYIIDYYSNYIVPLLFLICFMIPIYRYMNTDSIAIQHKKWFYFLMLCVAWSHEIIALFTFIVFTYAILYSIFIKKVRPSIWFYGLIIPWILGFLLIMIGAMKRIQSNHDNLANHSIFGFLKEQKLTEAILDAFIGYPQNIYILTVFIVALISLFFHIVSKSNIKDFVLVRKWYLFLLEFTMLLGFSVSNYIFLHSTKKIAGASTILLLYFTFVICLRLLLSIKLNLNMVSARVLNIFGIIIIFVSVLLPISPIYTAYQSKLQRDVIYKEITKQTKLGIRDVKVFTEYNPKNIFRELGIFNSITYGGTLSSDKNNWENKVFVDYYNYHYSNTYYDYKYHPIINSISTDNSLENPVMNPGGILRR